MKRLLLVSVLALAACQAGVKPDAQSGAAVRSGDDPCGESRFSHLVGTSGDAVQASMFPQGTRVLRPGMVMTMDYRADRLNVVINPAGKVDRVYCG